MKDLSTPVLALFGVEEHARGGLLSTMDEGKT